MINTLFFLLLKSENICELYFAVLALQILDNLSNSAKKNNKYINYCKICVDVPEFLALRVY